MVATIGDDIFSIAASWVFEEFDVEFLAWWAKGEVLHQAMHVLAVDEHTGRRYHGRLDGGGGVCSGDTVDFLDAVAIYPC